MEINTQLFQIVASGAKFSTFVEYTPNVSRRPCPACGISRGIVSYHHDTLSVECVQSRWPDVLVAGEWSSSCVVSEGVLSDLIDSNLTGFEYKPFPLPLITQLKWRPTFAYYLLDTSADALLVPILPDSFIDKICPVCGQWNYDEKLPDGSQVGMYPLALKSWDGSDFVAARWSRSRRLCCSRRVVDLAVRRKWSNIEFVLLGTCPQCKISVSTSSWKEKLHIQLVDYKDKFESRNGFQCDFGIPPITG